MAGFTNGPEQPRTGHQDRAYTSRIERLRKRAQRMTQEDPRTIVASGILLGMLDVLADLVADQEETGK